MNKIENNDKITVKEGYDAMLRMLYNYWKLTDSEDLTDILGGGSYLQDGLPGDPAFWKYWQEAVEEVKLEGPPPVQELRK